MPLGELVGYTAAFLTTVSFVPQVCHTLRSRDVSGISLGMYACFTLGIFLWLIYGLMLEAWPVVFANAITLALAFAILTMKLRFGRQPSPARKVAICRPTCKLHLLVFTLCSKYTPPTSIHKRTSVLFRRYPAPSRHLPGVFPC